MSERKVLNKYYPPDFDPSKIPRMKLPKNRQYTVRLMAPFNMRCKTCGEYIYKGKKFNARKEDVEGQDYLGIRIYRFYIKCTRCLQEISFKTDPKSTDYEIEAGATRNFMALKLAEEQAQREEDERKEDEATNPMKLLENRTKQSKQELELLESLEELRDLNRRHRAVDYDSMLAQFDTEEMRRKLEKKQEEEDEKYIKSVFGSGSSKKVISEEIVEILDGKKEDSSDDEDHEEPPEKCQRLTSSVDTSSRLNQSSNIADTAKNTAAFDKINSEDQIKPKIVSEQKSSSVKVLPKTVDSSWNQSIGGLSKKNLIGLVRVKQSVESEKDSSSANSSKTDSEPKAIVSNNSLSLLGSYSSSDSE